MTSILVSYTVEVALVDIPNHYCEEVVDIEEVPKLMPKLTRDDLVSPSLINKPLHEDTIA